MIEIVSKVCQALSARTVAEMAISAGGSGLGSVAKP